MIQVFIFMMYKMKQKISDNRIRKIFSMPGPVFYYSLLTILFFWACGEKPGTKTESNPPIPRLDFVQVKKGILPNSMDLPGELISYQRVELYAKENSFVKQVLADVGTEVKSGQVLAKLEAPELLSDLSASQAKMKSQEALWISSRFTYSKLLETSRTPGTISPNDLQEALSKRNSDSSQYISSKASLKAIQDRLSYLTIKAPFSGRISLRNINPGAYVGPAGKGSDTPLFILEDYKKLRLVISVPEDNTPNLKTGTEANFEVRSIPGKIFTARLIRMSGSLSNALRSERLEMDIDNSDGKLLPGMTASVHFSTSTQDSTLLVPISSVMETSHGTFVIKLNPENKVEYVPVKRGNEGKGQIVVFGKLEKGDKIALKANEEIRAGSILKDINLVP